ncbi:precorrin-2/cobalt-factor-2 C20-methyltransferase [Propionispira arboris]|uniref:Precorrin-2/cobalt-factor-2 C20-methyltransferase n=1 Tax=Propionispira arboris TaxID=84035 RepID=A0A1H7CKF7_9FIRM|nr:precorrin-2 C(20)-methyltransferase [Propionispira arboris]SEJ86185.1 precorrin-2/cobalt-factor-2 C20-methyltransferase [Propionispira arboris]
MSGIFYGIGVGPGDPELLTVKAINIMKEVDIIIAPKTEKKDGSVALSIARPYLKKDIEIVYQVFPMVVKFEESTAAWETNKNEILALLKAGKKIAFLTLGDPMFYSTYIYVYRLLEHEGFPIETIPGIPAFCAIGSKLGYPLVEGNDILSVIPATADPEKIKQVMAVTDNVVLMKVYKNFSSIVDTLVENEMIDNAVMLSRCGLPDEVRISDLVAEKDKKVNYLSTILARRK